MWIPYDSTLGTSPFNLGKLRWEIEVKAFVINADMNGTVNDLYSNPRKKFLLSEVYLLYSTAVPLDKYQKYIFLHIHIIYIIDGKYIV